MPAFAACLAVLYVSSDICCGFSSKTRVLLTQSFWKSACKRASEKLLYNHDNKSESLCTSAFRDCELEVYATLSWLSWLKGTYLLPVIEKGWYPDEDRALSMLDGIFSNTFSRLFLLVLETQTRSWSFFLYLQVTFCSLSLGLRSLFWVLISRALSNYYLRLL